MLSGFSIVTWTDVTHTTLVETSLRFVDHNHFRKVLRFGLWSYPQTYLLLDCNGLLLWEITCPISPVGPRFSGDGCLHCVLWWVEFHSGIRSSKVVESPDWALDSAHAMPATSICLVSPVDSTLLTAVLFIPSDYKRGSNLLLKRWMMKAAIVNLVNSANNNLVGEIKVHSDGGE